MRVCMYVRMCIPQPKHQNIWLFAAFLDILKCFGAGMPFVCGGTRAIQHNGFAFTSMFMIPVKLDEGKRQAVSINLAMSNVAIMMMYFLLMTLDLIQHSLHVNITFSAMNAPYTLKTSFFEKKNNLHAKRQYCYSILSTTTILLFSIV